MSKIYPPGEWKCEFYVNTLGEFSYEIRGGDRLPTRKEARSNCALISRAPKLLEFLKLLVRLNAIANSHKRQAQDEIDRAEGRK